MSARLGTRLVTLASPLLAASVVAFGSSGCAAATAAAPRPRPRTAATTLSRATPQAATAVDRLAGVARRRYAEEIHGGLVHRQLRRLARDQVLRRALQSTDQAALRDYVRRRYASVWYHWHISRLRIVRGSKLLSDTGVPFVVAPAQMTLRDVHGRYLATLEVSDQDVIGFVRFMHRNYAVDVVVRGAGPQHVRTSLPAALRVHLPSSGTVIVGGRRYQVRSFGETAMGGERIRIWILHHA